MKAKSVILIYLGMATVFMGGFFLARASWLVGTLLIVSGCIINLLGWMFTRTPKIGPPIRITDKEIPITDDMTDDEVLEALINNVFVTGVPMTAHRKPDGTVEVKRIQ